MIILQLKANDVTCVYTKILNGPKRRCVANEKCQQVCEGGNSYGQTAGPQCPVHSLCHGQFLSYRLRMSRHNDKHIVDPYT